MKYTQNFADTPLFKSVKIFGRHLLSSFIIVKTVFLLKIFTIWNNPIIYLNICFAEFSAAISVT